MFYHEQLATIFPLFGSMTKLRDSEVLIKETTATLLLKCNSSALSHFTPIYNEISYRGKPFLASLLPTVCFDFSGKLFVLTGKLWN